VRNVRVVAFVHDYGSGGARDVQVAYAAFAFGCGYDAGYFADDVD
jgi:hypothetical protein